MNQAIILLCGVPASGKTWVMRQLAHKFELVEHDHFIGYATGHLAGFVAEKARGPRPVLIDCPFAERTFKESLEALGLEVYPFFIVEPPEVIAQRYAVREGKMASQATLSRAVSIASRAAEWGAPAGTSDETLEHLRELVIVPSAG